MKKIAIDGPSGAGKSTLARKLADALGFIYVDTGAFYRTVGLYVCRNGIDVQNTPAIIGSLNKIIIELKYIDGVQTVLLNGEDVKDSIRMPEISMYASAVSKIPEVRSFLLALQRDITNTNNVIMDGRDIGTVILPDAEVKLFLTASPEERAKRRYRELREAGFEVEYEEVYADMVKRDENDANRAVAPAVPAKDAIIVDTTGYDLKKTEEVLLDIINSKL